VDGEPLDLRAVERLLKPKGPGDREELCEHGVAADCHCCWCHRNGFFPPEDCCCEELGQLFDTGATLLVILRETRRALAWYDSKTRLLTRWPCPCCGRKGAEEPLRPIEVKDEAGQVSWQGCHYCNMDECVALGAAALTLATDGEGR
jgi:hypothetical protein